MKESSFKNDRNPALCPESIAFPFEPLPYKGSMPLNVSAWVSGGSSGRGRGIVEKRSGRI
ncbi:hypothetical protein [Paenibacillus turicensis]|uniref:hypothetical protein n=1 Tax=Paenibacillus turicensis TaxID=160487 RepID=UPI001AE686B6|nr:hypothetical protein [Paenibacillus turicensis]